MSIHKFIKTGISLIKHTNNSYILIKGLIQNFQISLTQSSNYGFIPFHKNLLQGVTC